MNRFAVASVAVLSVFLVACGTTAKKSDEATPAAQVEERDTPPAEGTGTDSPEGFSGHPLDDPSSPLSKRVIYFEYDSSEVTAADRDLVSAHAQYLAKNPDTSVTLEGHADERGSREYNIGLGERRAQAVRSLMAVQGASDSQLKIVSYGEERPATEGQDESSWQQNRRVELVYPPH